MTIVRYGWRRLSRAEQDEKVADLRRRYPATSVAVACAGQPEAGFEPHGAMGCRAEASTA